MLFDNLPLRAIVFQFLFLLCAIAIEGWILHRRLNLAHKVSMQYSATINLLSTVIGWLVFYAVYPLLPTSFKIHIISYIFFERFLDSLWQPEIATNLVIVLLGCFFGTFLIELKSLDLLEFALGKREKKEVESAEKVPRFRGGRKSRSITKPDDRTFALFIANSCSFSVILLLLLARFLDQTRFSIW